MPLDLARQRWLARLLLFLGVAAGALWLAQLDYGRKVSTDLLDLIPRDEREPELMLARSLANAEHAKVVLLALRCPGGATRPAAEAAFVAALRASAAFAEVVPNEDTAPRDALGRHVFEHRLDLLAPGWLARRHEAWTAAGEPQAWPAWLAEDVAARLEGFLSTPEAMPFQDLLPSDPLLLVPDLAGQLQAFAANAAADTDETLIWAKSAASPLDEGGQQPVFDAVARALEAAHAVDRGATLRWASVARFAAENRQRIKGELEALNLVSFVAVLGVAALGLRRLRSVLHLAPVLACAVLAGWAGVTLAFERVHVLVFVIGSLLGGVAIDYGFYLQLQPPLHPGEPYAAKVRRLLRPLLSSSLTTVLGFLLLVVSDLPLIRQLGVFISAGLLGALAAALLWFGQLGPAVTGARAFLHAPLPGRRGTGARWRIPVLVAAGMIAVLGPWHARWHDDVRELESVPKAMDDEAAAVRALFGNRPDRALYVTRGATVAEARAALGRFLSEHARSHPEAATASLGLALPEPADWEALSARRAELAGFPAELDAALERHGFDSGGFSPFLDAWNAWMASPLPGYGDLARQLAGVLRGPLALSLSVSPDMTWFLTVADHDTGGDRPPERATISLNQLQSLNELFHRYRVSALRLSCIGLALVGGSVFWIYGLRAGWRIFLLPVSASLFAFGVFGLAGQPLNLFHLLGAFLGVCLSHNYAIFTAENARWSDQPAPSVRLSAVTTAVSFTVLAFSHIPVVAALGSTVALIVATALVLVELAPPARKIPA